MPSKQHGTDLPKKIAMRRAEVENELKKVKAWTSASSGVPKASAEESFSKAAAASRMGLPPRGPEGSSLILTPSAGGEVTSKRQMAIPAPAAKIGTTSHTTGSSGDDAAGAASKAAARLQATSHLALRKDAPKTKYTIRADVKMAEAVTSSAEAQSSRLRLLFDDGPKNSGLVVGFMQTFVFAVFVVLREVEAALVLRRSVTVDADSLMVSVWLPASKTDPHVNACERRWGCLPRRGLPRVAVPVPRHREAVDAPGLDVWPSAGGGLGFVAALSRAHGGAVRKERSLEMIEDAAVQEARR